ncbi:MAG TPA: isoaspartyl peptidase/L-asparaginase [Methanomassiliicoccales archaeon]
MTAIIVHGGAWDIPENEHASHLRGCEQAVRAGHDILSQGGSSMDAVEKAVRILEDDPTFDAGRGSFLNDVGEVEMDAMIMNGKDLQFGSVAAVRNIRHPITLARRVMDDGRHCMLTGQGATDFARYIGMEMVPTSDLLTEREIKRWNALLNNRDYDPRSTFGATGPKGPMGTVGAVAMDSEGNISAATSTGGTPDKMHGRVGDSPLVGCGTYADNASAGVSVTGYGESIMKVVLARRVCSNLERGSDLAGSAREAITYLENRVNGLGGVIAIDSRGNCVHYSNTPRMACASIDASGKIILDI